VFVTLITNTQKGQMFVVVDGAKYRGSLFSCKPEEHKKRSHRRIISLYNRL